MNQSLNINMPIFYQQYPKNKASINYYTLAPNRIVIQYFRLKNIDECDSGIMEAASKVIVKSSRTIQVEARSL